MTRWKGTIAPAAGRDAHEKALFCADVELSSEGKPPARRRVRGGCVLIGDDGARHALDVSRADIVGWPAQVERARWREVEARIGELFADEAPRRGNPEVKLSVRQPGRSTLVVVDGELARGPDGTDTLVARRIALPSKANVVPPKRARERAAAGVRAVAPSGAELDSPATAASPFAAEPGAERGPIDRGGSTLPIVWTVASVALGYGALRCVLLVRAGMPHPSLVHATYGVAGALGFLALLALTRALGVPNEGAKLPGPAAIPPFTWRDQRRDTFALDVFAVAGFFSWAVLAASFAMTDVRAVVRTGDTEQREALRGGRQGGRLVDLVHTRAGSALLLAGAVGAIAWAARRRSARSIAALLRTEPGTMLPRAGEWNAFEGVVRAELGRVGAVDVARWALRRPTSAAPKPQPTGSADPFRVDVGGSFVVLPAEATWASTFASAGGTVSLELAARAWLPVGARALVAGRVERVGDGEGGEIVLAAGEEDAALVFATSPQQSPRGLLRSRLWLHRLTGLATLAALIAGVWMMLRG